MAKNEQSTISRTFRAAIRIGEDFYTVEETITLPIDAGDEEIARAVEVGMRIYEAQRAAAEGQIRDLRAQVVSNPLPVQIREPDAPASEKQRAYMDYLLNELGWDMGRLQEFAAERHFDILTLNKRDASELIDQMKAQLEARSAERESASAESPSAAAAPPAPTRQAILPVGELATQRQVKALERLAEERGVDVAGEMEARFGGRSFNELSIDEAGQLLTEWQQRRNGRPMRRAA
ncbi:MAG TPA: hypothetical protein VE268_10780 [Herpetosiphonaceae bacterium]|jgi:BMFP domain-containing protein YqiC|nr:hypothetical protein [Herpetosiphonaceae bacterium]